MLVEKVQARVCGSRVFGEIEALNDCTVSKVTRQFQAFGCDCMNTKQTLFLARLGGIQTCESSNLEIVFTKAKTSSVSHRWEMKIDRAVSSVTKDLDV